MHKIKTISVMIVFLLIGLGTVTTNGQVLDGEIEIEVVDSIGVVYPDVNLGNENEFDFVAEFIEEENESYWEVNETISINLNITDNSGRENFLFPRTLMYSAVLVRNDAKLSPLAGAFKRIFPVIEIGKSINVVNSQFGENKSDTIEIPVQYTLANDSVIGTENMTLHLIVMGMLPGDVNGIGSLKIIEYKKMVLTVGYVSIL